MKRKNCRGGNQPGRSANNPAKPTTELPLKVARPRHCRFVASVHASGLCEIQARPAGHRSLRRGKPFCSTVPHAQAFFKLSNGATTEEASSSSQVRNRMFGSTARTVSDCRTSMVRPAFGSEVTPIQPDDVNVLGDGRGDARRVAEFAVRQTSI